MTACNKTLGLLLCAALYSLIFCTSMDRSGSAPFPEQHRLINEKMYQIDVVGFTRSQGGQSVRRMEAELAAYKKIQKIIREIQPREIVEKIMGQRLEGASGMADYASTGVAIAKELGVSGAMSYRQPTANANPQSRNQAIDEEEKLRKAIEEMHRASLKKLRKEILAKGKIIEEKFGNGLCAIKYQIPVGDLIALTQSLNAGQRPSAETYEELKENDFLASVKNPLSTFSIDVDTASYSNTRRYILGGSLPPKGAVRIEEFINYFHYDYPQPEGKNPFSASTELAECPWNKANRLLLIGLQGKIIHDQEMPPRNLIFLIDTSGSMGVSNKLPLLKQSMILLVGRLTERDSIGIVTYAGEAGIALNPLSVSRANKPAIIAAINRLGAGGSTAGSAGIAMAYKLGQKFFNKKGINRVILGTDGDFNVGFTGPDDLVKIIERYRKTGIYLTVLGFGMGNYKDATVQKLADKGNGNYAYIDTLDEATKVLVTDIGGTLVTIANDVKIQIEFNPAKVKSYRLIGYEKRKLADQDFSDDTKDAGEIGAGHSVTALYEIVPNAKGTIEGKIASAQELRYRQPRDESVLAEFGLLKLRYKAPGASRSTLLTFPVANTVRALGEASDNIRFSSAVASFAMMLRDSKYKGGLSYPAIVKQARGALGTDKEKYRAEFLRLVESAQRLRRR